MKSNRLMRAPAVAIAATALSLCSASSLAQLSGSVYCQAFAGNQTVLCVPSSIIDSAGRLLSSGSADASVNFGTDLFSAQTSAKSRSGYGNLGVDIEFSHFVSIGPDGGASYSLGVADASFSDSLTVTSSTLTIGAPVAVRVSGTLTGDEATSLTQGNGQYSDLQRNLVAILNVNGSQAMYVGYGAVDQLDGITHIATPNYSFSYVFETTVGTSVSFQGSLISFLQAAIGGPGVGDAPPVQSTYSGSLSSFNSSHTYFDAVTAGVSLVSASGALYASPVPMPNSSLLAGGGLVVLLTLAALRKQAGKHRMSDQ